MSEVRNSRWFTLVQRELQEYRVSLLWTPVLTALLLVAVMLVSVLVANRISAVGQAFMEVVTQDDTVSGMNIRIQIDDDEPGDGSVEYQIERELAPPDDSEWNFSREWKFKPLSGPDPVPDSTREAPSDGTDSFNPLLHVVNVLLSLVLIIVTINYLLGSLFDDRRDRSILFWKSMPVSEWEVVIAKLAVALVVAPLVFLAVSLVTQVLVTLLAMILVWRMDMDPFTQVLDNIDLVTLLVQQVGGLLMHALWVAPVYAWLLMASAAARRSPFLTAVVPVVALVLLEELLFGSAYLRGAIGSHLPWENGGGSAELPFYIPNRAAADLVNLFGGLLCAGLFLAAAVWLRRHRWEI